MSSLSFNLNKHLFVKDPQQSELGQKIISQSVVMIDQLGFEHFTFKKLALAVGSTEASIYRYFENKHRLLLYLISWYWSWIEYRIDMATSSNQAPDEKIKACIRIIASEKKFDPTFNFIDEAALSRIVIAELDKTYLTKWVDKDNQDGLFGGFKSLCKKMAIMVKDVDKTYPYPQSLVSTLILTAKQQVFFSQHLPSLTSISNDANGNENLYLFLENLIFKTLNQK